MGTIMTVKSSVKLPSIKRDLLMVFYAFFLSKKMSKVLKVIQVSMLSISVQFYLGDSGPTVKAEYFTKEISLHDKFPTLPEEECKGILS